MECEFNYHYERMRQHGEIYTNWLDEIPSEKWAWAFDGGHRHRHMTTSVIKCINYVLKGARNLLITALVRATYFQLGELFVSKGREAYGWKVIGSIFPKPITTQLWESKQAAKSVCITTFARQYESFDVEELSNKSQFKVDIRYMYYDCGNFQIDRYPCHHVIACCSNQNIEKQVYVDDVYKMGIICKVYEQEFEIVGHKDTWLLYNGSRIHPNSQLKHIENGRPRSTHFLNKMDMIEIRRLKHCGLYRSDGYSHRQCLHRNKPTS